MIPWATRLRRVAVALGDATMVGPLTAQIHATGLSRWVDDIVAVANDLYALDLLSDPALGNIGEVKLGEELRG